MTAPAPGQTAEPLAAAAPPRRTLFLLFAVSGFCSLLYQVVWLRLAFAKFGVITPVLSVVLSVFMLGLALGSAAGGRWVSPLSARLQASPLTLYAMAELVIGSGALLVPRGLSLGSELLLSLGEADSGGYLFASALVISGVLLPFCFCMGTTFPLVVAFLRESGDRSGTGFSFLYLGNVIGATLGVALTALLLVEVGGLSTPLLVAGLLNISISAAALGLSRRQREATSAAASDTAGDDAAAVEPARDASKGTATQRPSAFALTLLFLTGFVSMAMEVVWTRGYTPFLSTTIYAFAGLLGVYLVATFVGTALYRRFQQAQRAPSVGVVLVMLSAATIPPVLTLDPRIGTTPLWPLVSIVPLCLLLGMLTPQLIDQYAEGDPRAVGSLYGVNILGSILGPLVAAYLLLPAMELKWLLTLLSVPFFLCALVPWRRTRGAWTGLGFVAAAVGLGFAVQRTTSFEDPRFYRDSKVLRDHTATVVATHYGQYGPTLRVNGVGVAHGTAITKMMAHLPMAHHPKPREMLVIGLGMGATLRSAASWGASVTAVELVPSVRDTFSFFFPDAAEVLARGNARIVVDDGRRFLQRTGRRFDIVTIDPPPPMEAAGSSLLYSRDFYELMKTRMTDGAILQQWIPYGDTVAVEAATVSLARAFRHLRAYRSLEGWGVHYLASERPLPRLAPQQLAARLPPAARADLRETTGDMPMDRVFAATAPLPLPLLLDAMRNEAAMQAITDDRPINEYFLVRRLLGMH